MKPAHSQLAWHGGPPVLPQGAPGWPLRNENVWAALEAAYRSGQWGKYDGGLVAQLESELAALHDVPHVLTCCTGTFALELALRALKIVPGDEVLLAGYDFAGNFRAIEAVGARPVLVDVEASTWCLDVTLLAAALSPSTRAVIVSHLHGGVADMPALMELCRQRGVLVVEDACQTPGSNIAGRKAGTWGDIGVLSFGGSKLLTAGRGGAILTRDPQLAQRAKIFGERGNQTFALSELQAAVLLPQLTLLEAQNQTRQASAALLRSLMANIRALTAVQPIPERGDAAYYKFAWRYHPEACQGRSRSDFIAAAQAEGVAIDAGFRGFAGRSAARCRQGSSLAHSAQAAENTLVLHHPVLLSDSATVTLVATALRKVAEAFAQA